MPIIAKIGQLEGAATVLSDPQKLARTVQVYCEMTVAANELATMTDTQKLAHVANRLAIDLRRTVILYLREKAAQTAANNAEVTEDL